MEFAINYSPQADQLLAAGKIKIDRFKCPDWPDMIDTANRSAAVYVHFPLDAGSDKRGQPDFDTIDAMAQQTNTPCINFHLVAYADDFPNEDLESTSTAIRDAVRGRAMDTISKAVERFGRERVILENIPYPGRKQSFMLASVEPALVSKVIEQTGCGFLFDLSHARISAHHLGVEPKNYISQLPLHRLREMHLTGIKTVDGWLTDHMHFDEEDWQWVAWAMQQIHSGTWATPWAVALEYGGTGAPFAWRSDPAVIQIDATRLYGMLQKRNQPQMKIR